MGMLDSVPKLGTRDRLLSKDLTVLEYREGSLIVRHDLPPVDSSSVSTRQAQPPERKEKEPLRQRSRTTSKVHVLDGSWVEKRDPIGRRNKDFAGWRREHLNAAIAEITLSLLDNDAADDPWPGVGEIVLRTLEVDYCRIQVVGNGGSGFHLRADARGRSDDESGSTAQLNTEKVAHYTLLWKQLVPVNAFAKAMPFKVTQRFDEQGITHGLSVGIPGSTGTLGTLEVYDRGDRGLDDHEIDFLRAVAGVLGSTLERERSQRALQGSHALLEERVRQRTRELEQTNAQLTRALQDRETAEQALVEEQWRLTAILQATTDLVGFADMRGQVRYINEAGLRMLGFSQMQAVSGNMSELCPPWARKRMFEDAIPVAVREGVWQGESALLARDGREIPISQVIMAHKNQDGELEFLSTIARDITQQSRLMQDLHESREALKAVSARRINAQENERRRIARELHDAVGQSLTGIRYSIEQVVDLVRAGDTQTCEQTLKAASGMVQVAVEEVRNISMDLRPSVLDDLGILAAISWCCRQFETIHPDITLHKEVTVSEAEVPDELKIVIYRILQESLNNVAKHASANTVHVTLVAAQGGLDFVVRDTGHGMERGLLSKGALSGKGLGLANIRERVELSGGCFDILSSPGGGTTLSMTWPKPAIRKE